jgi:protein-disulfide isomerase
MKKNAIPIAAGIFVIIMVAWVVLSAARSASGAPEVARSRLQQDPVLGDPDAPVQIVEYGAYACSACRVMHESGVIQRIVDEFDGQVGYRYRDFPVISPTYDRMAAQAAQCALDQSNEGFWAFHDRLYTTDYVAHNTPEEFGGLAEEIGLDGAALAACVEADTHLRTIQFDQTRAERLGARGTPSFYLNGEPLFVSSYEGFRQAVLAALDG